MNAMIDNFRFNFLFGSLCTATYRTEKQQQQQIPLFTRHFPAQFECFFHGGGAAIACSLDRDITSGPTIYYIRSTLQFPLVYFRFLVDFP